MKKSLLLLAVYFHMAVNSLAQEESQTEYNFLRLPVSAHAAALGGDHVSLIEDDEALIFNNPALLSSVSDKTINFNYMNYMSGAQAASAAFNRTVGKRGSWAVSGQYVDYGKMKQVDEHNVQTGNFSAREISVAGYFSYMLGSHFAGGITAKLINTYLGNYNSMGFGVDLGINYYNEDTDWSVSAVVKNLGGQLKAYNDQFGNMPLDVQIGASKSLSNMPLRLSATLVDLNHLDYKFLDHLVLSGEFLLSDQFWIGGGYNFRRAREMKISSNDGRSSSHGAGLSLGAGLNLERLKINVAYAKYHVSASSVVLSLAFSL